MTDNDQRPVSPATPKQPRTIHPVFRALAAIFFSTLLTSLILLGMSNTLMYWVMGDKGGASELLKIELFWLLAPLILIYTAIFGLMIEWPKSRWMIRRDVDGKWLGLLVSLAASLIFAALQALLVVGAAKTRDSIFYGTMVNLFIGLLIGATSALFWWRLVVAPERKKRSAPVIAELSA